MYKLVFSLLLTLLASTLGAQDQRTTGVRDLPFFLDAEGGAFVPFDYSASGFTHFALGAGYRLHPLHAVGLEYRRGHFSNAYSDQASGGLGAVYRLTYRGLFAKVGAGLIVGSTKNEYESYIDYRSAGGGHYRNLTLGYRFRSGILIGASAAGYWNRRFDRRWFNFYEEPDYVYWSSLDELTAEDGFFTPAGSIRDPFATLTLTVGYAFPGRGRQ